MPEAHYGEPHRPPQPGIPQGEVQRLVENCDGLLKKSAAVDKTHFRKRFSGCFPQSVFPQGNPAVLSTNPHPLHPSDETGVGFLLKSQGISFCRDFIHRFYRLRNTGKKIFEIYIY
jgi:hypothetical protein